MKKNKNNNPEESAEIDEIFDEVFEGSKTSRFKGLGKRLVRGIINAVKLMGCLSILFMNFYIFYAGDANLTLRLALVFPDILAIAMFIEAFIINGDK